MRSIDMYLNIQGLDERVVIVFNSLDISESWSVCSKENHSGKEAQFRITQTHRAQCGGELEQRSSKFSLQQTSNRYVILLLKFFF